eukprot:scaffold38661_cov61-Phaeocystis_antarctica.AAC.2
MGEVAAFQWRSSRKHDAPASSTTAAQPALTIRVCRASCASSIARWSGSGSRSDLGMVSRAGAGSGAG